MALTRAASLHLQTTAAMLGRACRDRRRQVDASPHSVNVLPGYGSDPRTPDKLLDGAQVHAHAERMGDTGVMGVSDLLRVLLPARPAGVNLTSDDTHMWLAPFTRGGCHTVTVTLGARGTLGALRVWNYNKDRVGSLRGARCECRACLGLARDAPHQPWAQARRGLRAS